MVVLAAAAVHTSSSETLGSVLSADELQALGQRVGRLRRASGLSQRRLAAAAGVSHAYIALLEHARLPSPGTFRLEAVARGLGLSSAQALLRSPATALAPAQAAVNTDAPADLLLPVYAWGAPEHPCSLDLPPDPDHLELAPLGRATLIGPRGFGLLIRGDGLAERGILAGDVAWVNPERPVYLGKLVAVLDPRLGLVLAPHARGSPHAIGPVVGITSWRLPR